jgi:sodium-independent sulfate anion transporter 11
MLTEGVLLSPGTLIVLALSLLTPYFSYIPRSTLAAVLISAVVFMIDWKILITLWKCNSK